MDTLLEKATNLMYSFELLEKAYDGYGEEINPIPMIGFERLHTEFLEFYGELANLAKKPEEND